MARIRSAFDRLAKDAFDAVSAWVCVTRQTEIEVPSEVLRADFFCVPDPGQLHLLVDFPIVRRMFAEGAGIYEFFHQVPSPDEFLACIRKASVLRKPARLPARPEEPWLWVVSSGRPEQLIAPFGFRHEPHWPPGFYGTLPGLRLRLVIVSELPVTPDTLFLRALGGGATLRAAREELTTSPDHPASRLLAPLMVALYQETDDTEFKMETQELYEKWQQRVLAEGRVEGRVEGRAEGRADALLQVLAARRLEVSAEQLATIRDCKDTAQLDVWIVRAITAESTGEVFR